MKAILILDEKPECCNECQLKVLDADLYYTTYACKDIACETDDILGTTKYEMHCPLKPLPDKKTELKGRGKDHCEYSLLDQLEYRKGWNDCLETLLKGGVNKNNGRN